MKPSSFSVSLTLGPPGGVTDSSVVDLSYRPSNIKHLSSWGLRSSNHGPNHETGRLALVCNDGSIFLYRTAPAPINALGVSDLPPVSSTRPRRFSRGSITSVRSGLSTNSLAPALNVMSRSRIVSGVSKEQAEAPKNYVDFEDEPEKLKDILKGHAHTPKSSVDLSVSERQSLLSPVSPTFSSEPPPKRPREEPRSLLSATNSPSFTPRSPLSTPGSPRPPQLGLDSGDELQLVCHVWLHGQSQRQDITSVEWLDGKHLVVLQESGQVTILSALDGSTVASATVEEDPVQAPEGTSTRLPEAGLWVWKHLQIVREHELSHILISASLDESTTQTTFLDSSSDSELSDLSRVVMYEIVSNDFSQGAGLSLEKVGEWQLHGLSQSLGVYQERNGVRIAYHLTSSGQLVSNRLHFLPRAPIASDPGESHGHSSVNHASLALVNSFKAMIPRTGDAAAEAPNPAAPRPGRVALEESQNVGKVDLQEDSIAGLKTITTEEGYLRGLVWTTTRLLAFDCQGSNFKLLFDVPLEDIEDVKWLSETTYCLYFEGRAENFSITPVDANGDATSEEDTPVGMAERVQPFFIRSFDIDEDQCSQMTSPNELLATQLDESGLPALIRRTGPSDLYDNAPAVITLWRGSKLSSAAPPAVTSILPLELDNVLLGYSDGALKQVNLAQLCGNEPITPSTSKSSGTFLNCAIISLFTMQNLRTREWYIVGGGDDGSVLIWQNSDLKLVARWVIFISPLFAVHQVQEHTGPLRGCILCVSQNGVIAVIALDGFQFLYIIPASTTPLQRISLGGDNLLLTYEDGRSRLWDVKTREFWRSISHDKSEELLTQGGWTTLSQDRYEDNKSPLKSIFASDPSMDLASSLTLDMERFVTESTMIAKAISTSRQETRLILAALDRLRTVASTILTPGLNHDIDALCSRKLGIPRSQANIGLHSQTSSSLQSLKLPQDPWTISGEASASRALAIIAVLKAMSLFEELTESVNVVIEFYTTSLSTVIGPLYRPPDLAFLGRQWFNSSNEIRQAARVLLDASISRLTDDEAVVVAERWQHHLPCLQPSAERESVTAALALFLAGYIAAEKYALLSVNALTDISKSVAFYLHDEHSAYRALAIDLCSRGFHVWQHYVDAMELLRAIFMMATNTKKENITAHNTGPQARMAVLHIASINTPLFMTTLSLDILSPQSLEHRRSVMQIVAFLIRKRPLVLYPNLPRLMEAVVKSLDPNSTSHREAVFDAATEIIGHVVKSFPTIDFHMSSQRLAVGTSEGAAIMYDLKTGTRLYVLECHKKKITACSFSPDGRRLLTLSLEESTVLVWKVGTSFSSFFNPGAPPRQGNGGDQPFKTFPFNVGGEGEMSVTESLTQIRFEWIGDRSVRLKIRGSILTLST